MPQDLDALAAQLGGQPVEGDDLDALAAQLGGQPVTQPAPMAPVSSHAPEAKQRREAFAKLDPMTRMALGKSTVDESTLGETIKKNLPATMAFGAALAAPGLLTGAAAAGLAHYGGSRLRGDTHGEALGPAVGEGLLTGAMGGIVKIPKALGSLARRAVKGGLKIDRGYLEKMATARKHGLIGAENEIVDTVLEKGVNPVTLKGADKWQGLVDDTAKSRMDDIMAAPDVPSPGYGQAVDEALQARKRASYDVTGHPGVEPTESIIERVRDNPYYGNPITAKQLIEGGPRTGAPRDLTPRQMAKRLEADNSYLRGTFGAEHGPAVEAVKDVRRLTADALDTAAGTGKKSNELKRLIDVRNVSNIARRRAEARDVVGITDLVSLSAGRPIVLGATTAMRPAAQVGLGLGMNAVSRHIPLRGTAPERAILQELMRAFAAGDNAR